MLERVQVTAERWAIFAADEESPRGYVYGLEALEPAGLPLYSAVNAEGLELGVFKSLEAAIDALEAA
jgi:hypothetical protein